MSLERYCKMIRVITFNWLKGTVPTLLTLAKLLLPFVGAIKTTARQLAFNVLLYDFFVLHCCPHLLSSYQQFRLNGTEKEQKDADS